MLFYYYCRNLNPLREEKLSQSLFNLKLLLMAQVQPYDEKRFSWFNSVDRHSARVILSDVQYCVFLVGVCGGVLADRSDLGHGWLWH